MKTLSYAGRDVTPSMRIWRRLVNRKGEISAIRIVTNATMRYGIARRQRAFAIFNAALA